MDEKLKKVMDAENRIFPAEKLAITWCMIGILILISVFRGSGNDSPIDVKRCDDVDWMLFWILQGVCVIFEILAIYVVRREC